MCGRSARLAFLFLLLCAPAFGRTHNFFTNSPFGIGFRLGMERRPASDFAADPQTVNALNTFYAVEPFLDFGNFVIKPYFELHYHPLIKGSGTDLNKNQFGESSNANTIGYGAQLLLVPFVARDMASRAYIFAGGGTVSTKVKNERVYTAGNAYTEKAKGSGTELMAGAGFEFFLLQNYSLAIEGGYRRFFIDSFGYYQGVDVTGTTRAEGEAVKSQLTGRPQRFHEDSPFFALALNLNF